jgi:chromate transporter
MPKWLSWVKANAKIGALSFGGGRAMLYMEEVVDRRKWLSQDEFYEVLTIAQLLPGPNLVNLSAYISRVVFKNPLVSVLAVLALGIPGALFVVGFVNLVDTNRADVSLFFRGFSLASIVLFIAFVQRLAVPVFTDGKVRSRIGRGMVVLAVGAMSLYGIPLVWILLFGILAGVAVEFKL